jgi:hypothetical protein
MGLALKLNDKFSIEYNSVLIAGVMQLAFGAAPATGILVDGNLESAHSVVSQHAASHPFGRRVQRLFGLTEYRRLTLVRGSRHEIGHMYLEGMRYGDERADRRTRLASFHQAQ